MEAIPTIVCDTLYAMGLHDQTPSWKIMDNKGRITVVLCWDGHQSNALMSGTVDSGIGGSTVGLAGGGYPALGGPGQSRQNSTTSSTIASGGPRLLGVRSLSHQASHI